MAQHGQSRSARHDLKVAVGVVVYWLSVSAVPIANKISMTFSNKDLSGGLRRFPYPLATAFLQLSFVAVALALVSVARRGAASWRGDAHREEESWLFGPHFWYKVRQVSLTGACFGFKYGITNWGLQLLPTGTHLLLQATDLIWTVVLARLVLDERPSDLETLSALLVTVGTLMVGVQTGQTMQAPVLALAVNLATPVLLAICVVTLRRATVELQRPDNVLKGRISPFEITCLKLTFSAFVSLLLSLFLENGQVQLAAGDADFHQHVAWWTRLATENLEDILVLLLGGVFVLIFQVNLTWLISMTSAVTVGIVGSLKVVPQWLTSALASGHVNLAPLNLSGVVLVLGASIMYTLVARHHSEPPADEKKSSRSSSKSKGARAKKQVAAPDGCRWNPPAGACTDDLRACLAPTPEGP